MADVLYDWWMVIAALIPSIGLLILLWLILKHFVEGDRRERAAIREWEAQQDALRASQENPHNADETPGQNAGPVNDQTDGSR